MARELPGNDPQRLVLVPLSMPIVRVVVGAVPALVVVVFAGLIALIALFMSKERRDYALGMAERSVDLAAVLVGSARPRRSAA